MNTTYKILLLVLSVAICSCSSDEPGLPKPKLRETKYIEILMEDESGLNVLNTCDNTFSLIDDQLVVKYNGRNEKPNAYNVLKDGFCEYFQCDTCMAYFKPGQSHDFAFDPDRNRLDEYELCPHFDWDNIPNDYTWPQHFYWYVLSFDEEFAANGISIEWHEGGQSWNIQAIPTSEFSEFKTYKGDFDYYVNGVLAEKELYNYDVITRIKVVVKH